MTIRGKQTDLGVTGSASIVAAFEAMRKVLEEQGIKGDSTPCVAETVEAFLMECSARRLAESSIKSYRYYLTIFLARFGTHRLSDLSAILIETDAHNRPTWSDDTKRNYLGAIEVCLRRAGQGIALEKPARGSAGAAAVIPEHVYHQAIGCARGDVRGLLIVLWNTGARPSEIRGLTVEMVDWQTQTAMLRKHKTAKKTGKPRLLIFPPEAMKVLESHRKRYASGLLFRSRRGTAFTCPGLTQAVWRIAARIGHPLTCYGFRHSFCTDALAAGVPDTHVAALMGHGSTRMVNHHYGHLDQRAQLLKEAAAKVRPA